MVLRVAAACVSRVLNSDQERVPGTGIINARVARSQCLGSDLEYTVRWKGAPRTGLTIFGRGVFHLHNYPTCGSSELRWTERWIQVLFGYTYIYNMIT